MISRTITKNLKEDLRYFPVLSLTGPRQSGKTTLLRSEFAKYRYFSLENSDTLRFVFEDPNGFLKLNNDKIIIDEAQKAPELFSYLQGVVDEINQPGQFILSGSQNFLLHKHITQSLAGRVSIHRLFPFDLAEFRAAGLQQDEWEDVALQGGYPRIFDTGIPYDRYYPPYLDTYVTRDIEEIVNIRNVALFRNFVKLCAGRIGQLLNLSSLANDVGIDHTTAREWLTLLEGSYLVFLLSPYFRNFSKRIIKSPKLYFYDTGLACSLLGIKQVDHLRTHPLKGSIFENLIISDFHKRAYHKGERPSMYFWRDSNGNEIDLMIDTAGRLELIEIKAGRTINPDYFKGLRNFDKVAKEIVDKKTVIYGGDQTQVRTDLQVLPWNADYPV